jgi:signal transduction histidine kinase/DNA-binding response OmpR family regulator/HAMP domain-containing protein
MKISFRILLINFAIVVVIVGSSAIAFYSIMYNALTSQQSQYLIKSARDFTYTYHQLLQDTEDDFLYYIKSNSGRPSLPNDKNLDFIFENTFPSNVNSRLIKRFSKDNVNLSDGIQDLGKFLENNPRAVIKKYISENGSEFYYGRILPDQFLNDISRKINAEIAVIWKDSPVEVSNAPLNQSYIYLLSDIYRYLKQNNNSDVHSEGSDDVDIIATVCKTGNDSGNNNYNEFLIFTTLSAATDMRASIKSVLAIIGIAGVILSLILTFVFTGRFREQITQLNLATEITQKGNLKNRITIKSKDEIGNLAAAFNKMLDELDKNQRLEKDYTEFLTLINQNATLKEISDAALRKIIKTCNLSVGALYLIEDDTISLLSSYGLEESTKSKFELFRPVIQYKETIELNSVEKLPIVNAGGVSIELKHLLVVPVIYNKKVIAVLELGGIDKPDTESREYLSKIQKQLAIGLTNAHALVQLENLVSKLKKLNEDYQTQNSYITEQNEKLVELHKELEDKANELAVQKEKAEDSTRLKSQFLASMSHELRTPMNSILGLTELILNSSSVRGKNKERLEVVLRSGRHLMNLINDILDLSKIEAGRMDLRQESVSLDNLIEEVELAIKPLTFNKEVKFKVKRKINTNILILTDKGRVTQVLINLLGNAVKFTEKGDVELHISAPDDETLRFDVKDSGIGISESDLKIIFEEFRQVDGTSTRKFGGTGLGLSICKKIAEILGGSISVESEIGKGSTFSFSIPLNIKIKEKDEKVKINVETLVKNRKHPVLIIDDDPEIRYTIGQYLISRGYDVVYAEDGETGLQKAIELQPFAITLDVILPKKNGWTILQDIKEHPATCNIPVILISVMGDKNLGYGLGAFEYFVKPISPDKLLTVFTKLENLASKRIEKIVIVDDDEMEFEKFKNEFKNEKVRIDYIADSELAFSKILEVQPDLIILDLLMPDIDGISLSHKLKSHKETRHIPVIISTAKDLSDEEKNALNNIVEEITIKSKGHPLDVLKVVRDRIKMHEDTLNRVAPAVFPEDEPDETEDKTFETDQSQKENRGYVLIVDDDPDTLFTISEIVESCNCKTFVANSGKECLKILRDEKPDIILLDIMMPDMDGFQTLKRIRENEDLKDIPVFAVTAKAMTGDKEIILKHGFNDYIPKPADPVTLAFKIERELTKIEMS